MATPPLLTPIEQLTDGLQRCNNEAAEKAAEKTVQGLTPRLDCMEARLDRQDETLRMMWKQMTGNGRLPIDT